jgi:1,4-alpha-glucan branching enzyme
MHIGTFTKEGTFAAAAEKLEHIAELGFTCIELMPTTEYGGSWGYNPRACMSVHSHYGTPDDYRKFVDKAHSLGIAIMVRFSPRCILLWLHAHICKHSKKHIRVSRTDDDSIFSQMITRAF